MVEELEVGKFYKFADAAYGQFIGKVVRNRGEYIDVVPKIVVTRSLPKTHYDKHVHDSIVTLRKGFCTFTPISEWRGHKL